MNLKTNRKSPLSNRARSVLRWSGHFFTLIGVLALGYVGFVMGYSRLYQAYLNRQFNQELKIAGPSAGSDEKLPATIVAPRSSEADRTRIENPPAEGSLLGRIEIGAIGLSAMILEGTDSRTLRRSVGHFTRTVLPGQQGNVAIAGHRDTFFRGLRNIQKNDEITLTTLRGTDHYRVDSTQVVDPEDMRALEYSDKSILTLVTCYPFYFVGPAPQRFIVRAHKSLR
jgi:sortase A